MGANEVEHGAERLAVGPAQTPAELLEEQRRALGGPQHQHRVDGGHVDTLVEQVDREHRPHPARRQVGQRLAPLELRGLAGDRHRLDAVMPEPLGHVAGVGHAHTEPQAPHRVGIVGVAHQLVDHRAGPGIGARVQRAQRLDVIALPSPPRDVGQVEPVVDPEVGERHQPVLVDGVPQAQLGGDAVVEPAEDRQAVAAFGGLRDHCHTARR